MRLLSRNYFPFYRRWVALLICLIVGGVFVSGAGLVQAEGSRDLYPNGATGNRANINWRTGIFGQLLLRRTLLKVYARNGEFILVASSAIGDTSNQGGGTGVGDILIYPDSEVGGVVGNETLGTPAFSCLDQRNTVNPNLGDITSRNAELAGPDTIIDATTGQQGDPADDTYAPCFYPVTQDGIYYVVFYGPEGDGSDFFFPPLPTGQINLTTGNSTDFGSEQRTSISAWDVTVRDSLTSTADIRGRLFTDYLSMVTGANNRFLNSTLYVLTRDGYIYQTDLGGIDPNAFVFFANSVGFLDNGVPLYRDVVGANDNLDGLPAGISLALPDQLLFFNPPSSEAIAANGIGAPVAPTITSIGFTGSLGGNDTLLGAGGTFTYESNTAGIYELIISRDGLDFDPTLPANRVLRGLGSAPSQNVSWDGLDNSGAQFPVGTNYPVKLIVRAGEYHFPLLDAENSQGGPRYVLTNPPGGCPTFNGGAPSCTTAFYDDRGYTTSGGTNVGTPGTILPGNTPPNTDRSDPLAGFDTATSNQRAYGNGTINGFGDRKGLDIWTYFPSNIISTTLNIFATPPPTPTPTTPPPTPTPTTPPPTPTDVPPSPTPTKPPSSDDGDPPSSATSVPTATPTSTPAAVAVVPAPPTQVLPVAFLPETGLRGNLFQDWTVIGGLLLVILGGVGAVIRFRHKD